MGPRRLTSIIFALAAVALSHAQAWRDQYSSAEYMIPMRDGTKLYTVVFVPKNKTGPFPILMERTPYGAGSPNNAPRRGTPKIVAAGYIMAFQDVRGKGKSEGDYVNIKPILRKGQPGVDESSDTYDTVDFLVKNITGNNGRVGLWGISYPGFYAGAGAVRNHPALKAVSPQAPVNDWFQGDDVHHNGVLFTQESFDFSLGFDVPRGGTRPTVDKGNLSAYDWYLAAGAPATYDQKYLQGKIPYWTELVDNDTYNQYWKDRALWQSFKDVGCAVLTVGGWFDKEDMYGALKLFSASEKQNPKSPNYLVMGPWSHGQWASGNGATLAGLDFGGRTGQFFQENLEFPFFERYLRGDESAKPLAKATMFESGVNQWRTYEAWPPKDAKATSLFLGGDKSVTWRPAGSEAFLKDIADPMAPSPYVADYKMSRRAPGDWLARDQRFLEERGDQITYRMAPLEKDLRIGGPVEADLWITTTGTDADFVVELIDEYPASTDAMSGYQMMVRGNIMRAKFRSSFEHPKPLEPGKATRVRFQLNDALHTFQKGHRIVVRVQSYWFPIAERNPNVFISRRDTKDSDYRKADIRILSGGRHSSRVVVRSLPVSD